MIFFDIDETLINQRQAEIVAARQFLRLFGHLLPQPLEIHAFCHLWRSLREKHLPPFLNGSISFHEHRRRRIRDLFIDGPELTDAEADLRFTAFLTPYRQAWSLFDDVRPTLDSLSRYPLGILSNGNSRQQKLKLARTGILPRFSTVMISEDLGIAKPNPKFYIKACRHTGCRPEDCIYVGDRLDADARSSREAGMRGVWINRYGDEAPLDVEVIHSLAELPSRLAVSGPGPSPQTPAIQAFSRSEVPPPAPRS